MYRKSVPLLGLAVAGATLAVTLTGCGGSAPARATRAEGSQVVATRSAGPRPAASSSSSSARPGSSAGTGPRATASPVSTPASSPASSSHGSGALADGLYTDAPDGTPHYAIALSLSGHDVITGSVNYLYQDGRIGTVGRYTGRLSSSGKLTVVFGDGKAMTGSYGAGKLTLADCRSVLTWAANSAGCRFIYHGHVP
jgi:hypothetical protein